VRRDLVRAVRRDELKRGVRVETEGYNNQKGTES